MKIADDKATLANIVLEAIRPSRRAAARACDECASRAEPSRALSPQLFAVDDPSRPSDLLGGLQLRLDKSPRNKKVCFSAHSFRRATVSLRPLLQRCRGCMASRNCRAASAHRPIGGALTERGVCEC